MFPSLSDHEGTSVHMREKIRKGLQTFAVDVRRNYSGILRCATTWINLWPNSVSSVAILGSLKPRPLRRSRLVRPFGLCQSRSNRPGLPYIQVRVISEVCDCNLLFAWKVEAKFACGKILARRTPFIQQNPILSFLDLMDDFASRYADLD